MDALVSSILTKFCHTASCMMYGISDPPQDVTVVATGFDSLEISWEPPQQNRSESEESTIIAYIIFCDSSTARTVYSRIDPQDNLMVQHNSLTPHTTYTCCVFVNTTNGQSSLVCDSQATLESGGFMQ